jgi:hypothetical protein
MIGVITGAVIGCGLCYQFLDDEDRKFYKGLFATAVLGAFGGYFAEGMT